jgi:hypothetical protein
MTQHASDDWSSPVEPTTPPSIVAVPAAGRTDLRGARLLIGVPGLGWRGDLRGDSAVVQASRTYVPVLSEQEWYRAEAEQIEVFAPLVPIDRVWAETTEAVVPGSGSRAAEPARDLFGRLVSLDGPPRRLAVPVRDMPTVTGRRVVLAEQSRALRDLRAVTEVYQSTDGDICVRVCSELDWYRWAWNGQLPRTREVPIYLLWAE